MWIELFQNFLDQYARRKIKPPKDFLKDARIPRPTYPAPPAAVKALEGISRPPEGTYLVKYGKRRHIPTCMNGGSLKIAPAREFLPRSLAKRRDRANTIIPSIIHRARYFAKHVSSLDCLPGLALIARRQSAGTAASHRRGGAGVRT